MATDHRLCSKLVSPTYTTAGLKRWWASAKRNTAGWIGVADVCIFDPAAIWSVTPAQLASQGKHTPFAFDATGFALPGRVRATLVAGTVAYEASAR